MESNKKRELMFRPVFHAYANNPDTDMDAVYKRYLDDPEHMYSCEGKTYYKIIECIQLFETGLLVTIDDKIGGFRDDTEVVDEKGQKYRYTGVEMFRCILPDPLPDWYFRIKSILIEGDVDSIGRYLARAE